MTRLVLCKSPHKLQSGLRHAFVVLAIVGIDPLASDSFATTMRPTPAELEVARALIARVKAADPSINDQAGRRAAGVRRSRMSGRRVWRRAYPMRTRDGQDHQKAVAGDRVGRSA